MKDKESTYDTLIAHIVKQLLDTCEKEGLPLFLTVQYSDESFCNAALDNGHPVISHHRALAQCAVDGGVNTTKYLTWVNGKGFIGE